MNIGVAFSVLHGMVFLSSACSIEPAVFLERALETVRYECRTKDNQQKSRALKSNHFPK